MKNYRRPFVAVLVINILLVLALAFAWCPWHGARLAGVPGIKPAEHAVSTSSSGEGLSEPSERQNPSSLNIFAAPLVPVQLSPQRLQSIGAKTGEVEMK